MESMNLMFLIFAFLFFISIVATRLSAHLGMPLLLVFLGVGMLAGEEGIGGIQFSNFLAANMVGQLALAIILLDGGLRTSTASFRISLKPAVVLASWGVLATVLVLGAFATYFFDVRETKAGDYYLTITESKKNFNESGEATFEKHKIYLYKEDFKGFLEMFNETKDFIIEQKGEDVISEKHDKDFKSRSFTIDSDEDF